MITIPEQIAWVAGILHGHEERLRNAKRLCAPEAEEEAQRDYDCALAVMATLLATINAQQAVKAQSPQQEAKRLMQEAKRIFDGRDGKIDA